MAFLLVIAGLLMLALGLIVLQYAWRQMRSERVMRRLQRPDDQPWQPGRYWLLMDRLMVRAGLDVPLERLKLVLMSWWSVWLLGTLLGGWVVSMVLALAPLLLGRLYLSWRARRRMARIMRQLPQMLEHMVRSLQTGRTLGDAMLRAIEQAPEPLRGALARTQRNVQLGVPLSEALEEVAELYEQQELRILAIGVEVNQLYGGSAIELLLGLIKVINEREMAQRQLRAMTGETRLTALVLAVLPVGLAGYMLAINPQYLLSMWSDDSGRQMLIAAFAFQLLGCVVIWRMLRSI